nr:ribonuclease H-like domain-containing protein [Tanacetum cinerariifolium]GEZ74173.1 ribonuclease H-like domain-containing protein [Tanacetum cinerariifolium]
LQKLISQLEIFGESLSQEDINLKFLKSLPIEWRTHTLIWRNKTDMEDQSLDDLFNSLKMYEAEVKSSSSTSPTTQNIAFVSSQDTDNTIEGDGPQMTDGHADHASKECDGVGSYDWSFQADEEPTNYALMAFTSSCSTSSLSSDSEVAPCSKTCSKAYGLESVEARLVVYQQNKNVFEEDIKLLKLDVMIRDNVLVKLRKKFEKVKQERDKLKLKLENFQTSLKNLSNLLASQITDKTGLGYDNQVFNSTMFEQRVRRHCYGWSRGCIQTKGRGIAELDANEDITLETVDAKDDTDEAKTAEVEEVIEVDTAAKLMTEVVTTTATTITDAQVPKASAPRRRKGVVIHDPEETTTASVIVHSEDKSKDKGKGILIEEPKSLKRQAQIEQDEAFARELEAELNDNIN